MNLTVPAAEKFWSRSGANSSFTRDNWFFVTSKYPVIAQKIGEVVEPAGGETGVPRCLAEVHKLL